MNTKKIIGGIVLNGLEENPLGPNIISYLCSQKKESPFLDFKKIISIDKNSTFPNLAKDMFAFSNYGGGWMLIGWEEYKKNQFVPVGLPEEYSVDQADLQSKFNSYSNSDMEIGYVEFENNFQGNYSTTDAKVLEKINSISKRFALIYIPPSHTLLSPKKEGKYTIDGKEHVVFKIGDIFYRRGTQNVVPGAYELTLINKRIRNENYRLSLLGGEPDMVEETLYSNLFEITSVPKYVYEADSLNYDNVSIKTLLKQNKIFPEFYYKFKFWNKKLITFENLQDNDNPYRQLVDTKTICKTSLQQWITNADKHPQIIELLNREIKHFIISRGLWHNQDKDNFFYPSESESRKEVWQSRYRKSNKTVAAKMYAEQIKKSIYWHIAFSVNVLHLRDRFYIRILPTFVITENGRNPISNFTIGTIITRLSYSKYNSIYLNTVLFWIYQLGTSKDILLTDYMTICSKPVEIKINAGILFDMPSSEFTLDIADDEIYADEEINDI
jgi:hypothetical protein